MESLPAFETSIPDCSVYRLAPEDAGLLQSLYDRCADYTWIVEGKPVSPAAAQEEFQSIPPGKTLGDKFVFGLVDSHQELAGMLEGVQHYPDQGTWWIGLLLLAPSARGRGMGRKLVSGFTDFVRANGGTFIMLGVVEDNAPAYTFWQHLGFEPVRKTEPRQFGKKTQAVYMMRRDIAG
jgi:ribosomal protein S18 acetylase RimI-like enzyme